jgi:hypothetical protein
MEGQSYIPVTLSPEDGHLDTHCIERQVQPSGQSEQSSEEETPWSY